MGTLDSAVFDRGLFGAARSEIQSLLLGGNDYLIQTMKGITITRCVNGTIGTLTARLHLPSGAFPVSIGAAVECDDRSGRVFTGYISRVQATKINQNFCEWAIACQDITRDLATVTTSTETFANTTDKAIIDYLFGAYLPQISTERVDEVDTIAALDLSNKTLLACLQALSDVTGAIWYLDPLKVLWYHDPQTHLAEHGLTEAATGPDDPSAIPIEGFTVTEEFTTPCNSCTVRNADSLPQSVSEINPTVSGDDGYVSRASSTTEYPPAGAYTVDGSANAMRAERTRTNNPTEDELVFSVDTGSASDGYVQAQQTVYPPSTKTVYTTEDNNVAQCSYAARTYYMGVILLGFNTASIPDEAEITAAELQVYNWEGVLSNAGATITGEWYDRDPAAPNWNPISVADWAATPDSERVAFTQALATEGPTTTPDPIVLGNGDSFIKRTTYTWLRIFVTTSGTPTGINSVSFWDRSYAGVGVWYPRLTVTYRSAGTSYKVACAMVRFDTSGLPVGAVVTGANLTLRVSAKNATVDAPDIGIGWYAGTNWPIDSADWTNTPAQSAVAYKPLSELPAAGSDWATPLLDAAAQVNLSGYTGVRIHLRTAANPTGANYIDFATQETATKPELSVSYTVGTLISGSYSDTASIALYGTFERRLIDTSLVNTAQAVARATGEVLKDAYPTRQMTAVVKQSGIGLGQWTHVEFESFDLSYDYAITGVTMQEQLDGNMKYALQMGDYRRDLIQYLRGLS